MDKVIKYLDSHVKYNENPKQPERPFFGFTVDNNNFNNIPDDIFIFLMGF